MDSIIGKLVTQLTEIVQTEIDAGGTITIEDTVRLVSMYAAVGQMEAAQRQAAAMERTAAATERRNELLAEFNEHNRTAAAAHTKTVAESVNSFLDAHFDKATDDD